MHAHPSITTLAAIGAALIVIDGDTIRSDEERIRLEGIDAAEIGMQCEAERRLAILAKHRLEQLLRSTMSISGGMHTRSRLRTRPRAGGGGWRGSGLHPDQGRLCSALDRAPRGLVQVTRRAPFQRSDALLCRTPLNRTRAAV